MLRKSTDSFSSQPTPDQIAIRIATAEDIEAMKHLIFSEGPNQWNHLPEAEVNGHMDRVASGETLGLLAFHDQDLVGLATVIIGPIEAFHLGAKFVCPFKEDLKSDQLGYIAEVVVHSDFGGLGIGSKLMLAAIELFNGKDVSVVYAKRHEENAASAGMLRKAGFAEVAVFDDPDIRTAGSRKTSVCRFNINS